MKRKQKAECVKHQHMKDKKANQGGRGVWKAVVEVEAVTDNDSDWLPEIWPNAIPTAFSHHQMAASNKRFSISL